MDIKFYVPMGSFIGASIVNSGKDWPMLNETWDLVSLFEFPLVVWLRKGDTHLGMVVLLDPMPAASLDIYLTGDFSTSHGQRSYELS